MRVTRSETVAGHPALLVRALFRKASAQTAGVTPELVRTTLSLPDDETAERVIDIFHAEGFVESHAARHGFMGCRVTYQSRAAAVTAARGGKVLKVSVKLERPLVLDTPERLREALKVQRSLEPGAQDVTTVLSGWAQAARYDGVVIPALALTVEPVPFPQPTTLVFTPGGSVRSA